MEVSAVDESPPQHQVLSPKHAERSDNGEVPSQAMEWLQKALEIERERQEIRLQEILETCTSDIGKVQRKQEQMSRKQEESFEQSEGQVRVVSERLYTLEKRVHDFERKSEDAIEKAGLAFQKQKETDERDRQNLVSTITQVNTNFERVSADMATHLNDKALVQQKLSAVELQIQQIRTELGSFGVRFEQQAMQSNGERTNVLQQVEAQNQKVNALEVVVQAVRGTAMTSTPQQSFAEAETRHRKLQDAFDKMQGELKALQTGLQDVQKHCPSDVPVQVKGQYAAPPPAAAGNSHSYTPAAVPPPTVPNVPTMPGAAAPRPVATGGQQFKQAQPPNPQAPSLQTQSQPQQQQQQMQGQQSQQAQQAAAQSFAAALAAAGATAPVAQASTVTSGAGQQQQQFPGAVGQQQQQQFPGAGGLPPVGPAGYQAGAGSWVPPQQPPSAKASGATAGAAKADARSPTAPGVTPAQRSTSFSNPMATAPPAPQSSPPDSNPPLLQSTGLPPNQFQFSAAPVPMPGVGAAVGGMSAPPGQPQPGMTAAWQQQRPQSESKPNPQAGVVPGVQGMWVPRTQSFATGS